MREWYGGFAISRRCRSPRNRWTLLTHCLMNGRIIRNTNMCLLSKRCSFRSRATAAVLALAPLCAITSHQGRVISSRSVDSVVEEAKKIIAMPSFKGYIHDVGGPSANFSRPACDKQAEHGACAKRQCLWPKPCANLKVDHTALCGDARCAARLAWREKVFIRSGIRYDYLMYDKDETFFDRLVQYHISGPAESGAGTHQRCRAG